MKKEIIIGGSILTDFTFKDGKEFDTNKETELTIEIDFDSGEKTIEKFDQQKQIEELIENELCECDSSCFVQTQKDTLPTCLKCGGFPKPIKLRES